MVAIEETKKCKTAQHGSKNYCPGNFQALYAREFADWIAIKRHANNQVMEVTCNWCCCFKKQANASSKFVVGYKDPFKRLTLRFIKEVCPIETVNNYMMAMAILQL